MTRPLALATLTLAPTLFALVAAAPVAGATIEERFNKRVSKLAFPLPTITLEAVGTALTKGKVLCVCREDLSPSADNRAGVVVNDEQPATSPLTRCLVPTAFNGNGDPSVVRQCEDWVPLTK